MRDFGDDVFAGAAKYYAKYRPSYPEALFKDIAGVFKLDGSGKLLDLGCGTGELAIPLAKHFKAVLAVDPDEGMLSKGKAKAKKAKITNIIWQKGSSKELGRLKGPFQVVVMGQSFHWMDQERVLEELYEIVGKSGGLAIVGTEPVKQGSLTAQKDKIVQKLIKKYLGPERRAGKGIYSHPPKKYEELLPNSKFHNFHEHYYLITQTRNFDQILGHLYSVSWTLKSHFGDQLKSFEDDLKRELITLNPGGQFKDKIRFSLYTLKQVI